MDDRRTGPRPDDVRYEMDATRARLSETADQLGDALAERKDAAREKLASIGHRIGSVRERVDFGELVQRHPLPVLGAAIGVGFVLAFTGADRSAATATTGAARRASRAVGDGLRRRRERSQEHRRLDEQRRASEPERPGLIERLTDGILSAINVDGLLAQLRSSTGDTTSRSPENVSRNRLANQDYWKG